MTTQSQHRFTSTYTRDVIIMTIVHRTTNCISYCNCILERLSSPSVCVPENGSLQSYKDFIDTLPRTDPARTFGQHPNASAMYLTKENRSLCETLRCLQVQSDGPSADDDDKDKQVLSRLSEIRQNIPPSIDYRCAVDNVETGKNILDVTILQEVFDRFG